MKPRFGLGRLARKPPSSSSEPVLHDGEVGVDEVETEIDDGISLAGDPALSPNEASIRPDPGPPAPGPQPTSQPGSGLGLVISVAVSAIVFVLAIYATGSPTANPLPLAQTTNALFWAVSAVATLAAGVGAIYADGTAARASDRDHFGATGISSAWIVPVISTSTAVILVATFHNTTMIVAGPLITFLGNAGSLLSRDLLDDAEDSAQQTATTIQALVIHTVAFLALSAVYLNKLSTPTTAILAGTFSTLLAVETVDRSRIDRARKFVFSLLAGGAVAAAVAPLMWWPTHGWTGGAVLFVVFYCTVGIIQTANERGGLRLRDVVEYGLVPLVAFLLLAVTS